MKKTFIVILFLFDMYSCHINDSSPDYSRIETQFKLYDTTGVEKYYYKYGEKFEMKFTALNNTGTDLSYQYSGPSSIFEIYKSDSLICTSVDGLAWAMVIISATIKEGEQYSNKWIVPNNVGSYQRITLPAGNYKAIVVHSCLFKNYKLPDTKPVYFVVYN